MTYIVASIGQQTFYSLSRIFDGNGMNMVGFVKYIVEEHAPS